MNDVFGGISEGVFAFFIIFCTLVGMITGAYLMDKVRFMQIVGSKYVRCNAILKNLPATIPCIIYRHKYEHDESIMLGKYLYIIDKCVNCSHETGRFDD